MSKNKLLYKAPTTESVGLVAETIICGSPWYLQGGQGDFNYTVEEENEFE